MVVLVVVGDWEDLAFALKGCTDGVAVFGTASLLAETACGCDLV